MRRGLAPAPRISAAGEELESLIRATRRPVRNLGRVTHRVTIDGRFNGPPGSGNGGYTCGLLANFIDGPAEVSLRTPPPLDRELVVERSGDRAALYDGETLVAEAEPATLDEEPPTLVPLEVAEHAATASMFLDQRHPFPTCFVCGPRRAPEDGLRIFAGPVRERELYASPWTPSPALRDAAGELPDELIWAALDCPTRAPLWNEPDAEGNFLPLVLARLQVLLYGPVELGKTHVITSWPISIDGRKRRAGAALFSPSGDLLAESRALWIELRAPQAA
jgi:hypothetical protein